MYIFISATVFTVLSILMGAFAHHALQSLLTTKELHSISVASRYLFYNSVPLLLLFLQKINGSGQHIYQFALLFLLFYFLEAFTCWFLPK